MESFGRWLLLIATVLQLSGMLDQGLAQQCNNRSFDFPSGVHNSPREILRGNLQLLIPEWRLNETGFIKLWQAVVTTTVQSQSIQFQLFRKNGSVYDLVYGNEYNTDFGHSQDGNRIDLPIDNNLGPPEIPINPGYVIGIRLNGTDPQFGLQCTTIGEVVDLYLWRGMRDQACSLSLTDPSAELVSGIKPLISWTFCPRSSLRVQESFFDRYIEGSPRVCSNLTAPSPTPSASSTVSIESRHSSKATPSSGLVIATSATKLTQSPTSPDLVTTGSPPIKEYIMSPTTIITLAIMIFLTILTLVLIVIVIILLRNALRKQNQVSRVTGPPPLPPSRPSHKPAPVSESHQLRTEAVMTFEEDSRPVHEVLI